MKANNQMSSPRYGAPGKSAPWSAPQPRARGLVQPKTTAAPITRPPAAPPAYRPQPIPKVLQTKQPATDRIALQSGLSPTAPPAYRPQPTPKVLQTKKLVTD